MNQYAMKPIKQLELLEKGIDVKNQSAKRVNVGSLNAGIVHLT